ncbi:MAG: flavin reductase, partial [Gemmatimonadetes bacterium]|nr:flavin reductase [Gemmatimonadota bacterium]
MEDTYALLQHLTLPLVALTSSASGRGNGMIANSAQRASLVPGLPRLSVYISKTNWTHELVYASGVFAVHLLRCDQWDVVHRLGLQSGRELDKLAGLELVCGKTGCPILVDAFAAFECRVINAMDAGASTFFLGDIVSVRQGTPGPIMSSEYFRSHVPDKLRVLYESRLARAQEQLEELAREV